MDHLLLLLLSAGVLTDTNDPSDPEGSVRLVGGPSRCAGTVEVKRDGEWRLMENGYWILKSAAMLCEHLDCGSALSMRTRTETSSRSVWRVDNKCFMSTHNVSMCVTSLRASTLLNLTCSDSVRLLKGSSLCSGRLQVKTNQTNQHWSPVCEADFDLQDAEVVCRELGCGSPVVLRGALYGDVQAPLWSPEFQCRGHESALLDCSSSGSGRTSCSPGAAVGLTCSEPVDVRLVGGASRCAGTVEVNQGGWRPVSNLDLGLKNAAVCEHLDCGSVVSLSWTSRLSMKHRWYIQPECSHSGSTLRECAQFHQASSLMQLTCADSVRLVHGSSLCSGRLQVKTNQTNQRWSPVCEADFDLHDAEVVCRELGCGSPVVLRGALYGDVQAPLWSPEFQCRGHESTLLDCSSSGSGRTSCSPGAAVGLFCSEYDVVRLVGGASRCAGTLQLNRWGEWRPVQVRSWSLKEAAVSCQHLDCGSVVALSRNIIGSKRPSWHINSECVLSGSALRDCLESSSSFFTYNLTCSDSVRLLNGSSLCSGRLQVKTNQINQRWSPVCEADFDLHDAEVVCRELGCGSPVVLRGALYGVEQAPLWSPEFQCRGHESTLLDCSSSGSGRTSCSPGAAVGLTCSEFPELRLVGGASRCAGTLELNRDGEWWPVSNQDWRLKEAVAVCRLLDCGSAALIGWRTQPTEDPVWSLRSECVHSAVDLRDCSKAAKSTVSLNITCSDSVRLLNGSSLCSGRLQVKTNQTKRWSPVCEADFDLHDAEVVCRELGCGSPVVLRGALYGDVQAPLWSPEFQCRGHESALLDCSSSGSGRTSCSPGTAVGLTCSAPDDIRLVGGASRCAGTVEVRGLGESRPIFMYNSTMDVAASFCEHLDCGSAVAMEWTQHTTTTKMWMSSNNCFQNIPDWRQCAILAEFSLMNNVTCADLLFQPIISLSSPTYVGVSQAQPQGHWVIMGSAFTVSCSIQPQYPRGSFQLTFTYSNMSQSSTQPAVNHSAHFLFPAAEPAHQGNYSCVYQVHVFQHDFSSESRLLHVSVTDPTPIIVRWVVVPLILVLQLLLAALWFHWKASRLLSKQKAERVYYY